MKKETISKAISGMLLFTMSMYSAPVFAYTKDETVYSKLDKTGKSYNTIVSTHIKNDTNEQIINDLSDLLNIENSNSDEKPEQNGNQLVWKANGDDIYYQGTTEKELPIGCQIKYELDGQEMDAKDIVGKSGKVKVTLQYTNKDKHETYINGKKQTIYTPFVVTCGTIIDNQYNKNITISSGKVVNNGDKTIVVGMSLPGLQESLNISKDKVEIPENIEITMETTKFEMESILTYITPKLIEEKDLDIFSQVDKIYGKVDTLQNSSKQLQEGINTLKDGMTTYMDKTKEFKRGVAGVSQGINGLNSSYVAIDQGINLLSSKSQDLKNGMGKISLGAETLNTKLGGINAKIEGLKAGTKNIENAAITLNENISKFDSQIDGITATDNSAKIAQIEKLIQTNKDMISKLENAKEGLSAIKNDENAETIEAQIETNNALIEVLKNNIGMQQETIQTLKTSDTKMLEQLKKGLTDLSKGVKGIEDGAVELYKGENEFENGIEKLTELSKSIADGSKDMYNNVNTLSEKTYALNVGSTKVREGLTKLSSSSVQLTEANTKLEEGENTLLNGVTEIANGIEKFNKEGIDTICNYINGNVKDLSTRLQKLEELSNEYNTFTQLSDGNSGKVKFITIIDAIKEE